jgi:hypothetical protein
MAYRTIIERLSLRDETENLLPYLLKLEQIFPEVSSLKDFDIFFYLCQYYYNNRDYKNALVYSNKEVEKYNDRKEALAGCLFRRGKTKCALGDKIGAREDMLSGNKLYYEWKGINISDTAIFCN